MIPTDLAPAVHRPAAKERGETAARVEDPASSDAFARLVAAVDPAADAARHALSEPETAMLLPAQAEPPAEAAEALPEGLEPTTIQPPAAEPPSLPPVAIAPAAIAIASAAAGAGEPEGVNADTRTPASVAGSSGHPSAATGPLAGGTVDRPASIAPMASAGAAPAEAAEPEPGPSDPEMARRGASGGTAPNVPAGLPPPAAPANLSAAAAEPGALLAGGQGWRLETEAPSRDSVGARPAMLRDISPREVAGQITLAITRSTQAQVEVRLDPPELGRVSIRLSPIEGGLQALVLAERPETQDFLRRHAEVLLRDLDAVGYESVSLDFATGHGADPRGTRAENAFATAAPVAEATEVPALTVASPRTAAADRLDIRL